MSIVHAEMEYREEENLKQNTDDVAEALKKYLASKPDNVLHYDMEEFLDTIHLPGTKMATGKKIFAENLFNKQMASYLMVEAEKALKDTLVEIQEAKRSMMSDSEDDESEENDAEEDESEENNVEEDENEENNAE